MKESYFEIYQAESHETPLKIAAYRVRKLVADMERSGTAGKIRKLVELDAKGGNPRAELMQIARQPVAHDPGFDLIKADVYKAMISRNNAVHSRTRLGSGDETFNGMAHQLGEKTIREQLDKICYDLMLLQANRLVVNYKRFENCTLRDPIGFCMRDEIAKMFQDEGLMPGFDSPNAVSFMTCLQLLYVKKEYFHTRYAKTITYEDRYIYFMKGDFVVSTDSDTAIENALRQIPYDADSDRIVAEISKIIDMVHHRGPLAGAFVEGGAETCRAVSGMKKDEIHESYAAWSAKTFRNLLDF